ncbi:hypothetical protein [Vulcanisaeta sp. JCM 14467]|uniref:hypothetical protein n=1 Tax=Vulcanisaeta sp. JCM 14467 TaxID=1295370 RepID=UPI0006D284F2|nr:hypothetical protein [Vulcanisaeta sp. JCM 14467]
MECNNEKVRNVVESLSDKEPIEAYQTLLEENCFGRSMIYDVGNKYIVYMKDEENACIEETNSIDRARELARAFVDSVCS